MFCSANRRGERSRLSPSTRLKAGNGWITSASVVIGVPNLIGSKNSPRIAPTRAWPLPAPLDREVAVYPRSDGAQLLA